MQRVILVGGHDFSVLNTNLSNWYRSPHTYSHISSVADSLWPRDVTQCILLSDIMIVFAAIFFMWVNICCLPSSISTVLLSVM